MKRLLIDEVILYDEQYTKMPGYEFLKDDELLEDPYTLTSDSSYDAEVTPAIRKAMGLKNTNYTLNEAFNLLVIGDWQGFLDSPCIIRKFSPVESMFVHFGDGSNKDIIKQLWLSDWNGDFHIKKLKRFVHNPCILCNIKRPSNIKVFDNNNFIGYVGADCYNIRFKPMRKLIVSCRNIADFIEYNSLSDDEFQYNVVDVLQTAIDRVNAANNTMVRKYKYAKKHLKK